MPKLKSASLTKTAGLISLMRPAHAVKNMLLFFPLFFDNQIMNRELLWSVLVSFAGFSLYTFAVYIFNDLYDLASDKLHPLKKNRPLAAGLISRKTAVWTIAALLLCGTLILYLLQPVIQVVGVALLYLLLNLFYTLKLKHLAIIDVAIIALGFVLRIVIGGLSAAIVLSHWIIIVTFLGAIFLALAKRHDDLAVFNLNGQKTRTSIDGYNLAFLTASMSVMASVIIIVYVTYTLSPEVIRRTGENFYMTTFFIVIGILRYLQFTFVEGKSGNPVNVLFSDRFLQLMVTGWLISTGVFLYA